MKTDELIQKWRKAARDCMAMARQHDKAKREEDRYRWFRVAQTFRVCAKELRAATKH